MKPMGRRDTFSSLHIGILDFPISNQKLFRLLFPQTLVTESENDPCGIQLQNLFKALKYEPSKTTTTTKT